MRQMAVVTSARSQKKINHLIDKLDLGEDKTRREEAPGEGRTNKSPVVGLKVIKTTAGWGTRKTPPSRKSKNNMNETRMVPRNKRAWSKQSSIRGYFISSPKVGKVGEVVLDKENGRTACNEAEQCLYLLVVQVEDFNYL